MNTETRFRVDSCMWMMMALWTGCIGVMLALNRYHNERGAIDSARFIRGGFSVSVPLAPLRKAFAGNMRTAVIAHFILWLLGSVCIRAAAFGLRRRFEEREISEKSEARALKLESLGALAGGIAHDFNNLLTIVLGNLSLAKMNLNPASDEYDLLDEAEKASRSAKELTARLLTFAKGGAPVLRPLGLGPLIEKEVRAAIAGYPASYTQTLKSGLRPVLADEKQLAQVLRLLALNAAQAMPDGGTLTVTAEVVSLPQGDFVRISLRDEGVGIDEKLMEKIFDPYFSTKQKGRGLGLSTCRSIIEKHGGFMDVESERGEGSTFSVHLPAAAAKEAPKTAATEKNPARSRRILIMDDDPAILKVLSRILAKLGHETESVRDGAEALAAYDDAQKQGRPFDLVIMDLTIPGGMGGKEAVHKLHEKAPGAKVVVSSGYSDDGALSDYAAEGFCAALGKPYEVDKVAETLERVFDGTQ